MAGPQKANPKKKNSFLDEELSDDFLGSWKSMSVMEDDKMDFSFDTGPKGKKKGFDFGKMDMDFNLDGDFDKISSFKMDMDFDFSSPPKKAAKSKEVGMSDIDISSPPQKTAKTKEVDMSDLDLTSLPRKAAKIKEMSEVPSKGKQGSTDHFDFSLEFNGFDSFDLDSTLTTNEKSAKQTQDGSKEVVSDRAECQGSKVDLFERISTLDGDSEIVATSIVDTLLVDQGNTNSTKDCASKSETSGNFELPSSPRFQEKILTEVTEESDQQSPLPEESASPKPYPKQTTHGFPGEHVGIETKCDTVLVGSNDAHSQITEVNSTGNEDANESILPGAQPDHEDLSLKDPSQLNNGSSGCSITDWDVTSSHILKEHAEPAKIDLDIGGTSATFVLRKSPYNIKSIEENQNSTLKFPLFTQTSESTVEKDTMRNESGAGEFQSQISKRLEDTESQLHQPPLVGAKSLLSGNKKIGTMHLRTAIEKGGNDAQKGSKLLANPVLVDKETKVRPVIPGREGSDSDGVPNGTKLVGRSLVCDNEVTERQPIVGSEQRKNLKVLSVQVSLSSSTDKTRKPSCLTSVNPKLLLPSVESMKSSKIVTAEGNKLGLDKPSQKKSDLSTWKISKNIGGNKVPLNAAPQNEVKSQWSSEQNKKLQGNVELKTPHVVEKLPQNLPLKRKSFEGLNPGLASLKPLKRISLSPRETRNFKEPAKGVIEEQVFIHENPSDSKTKSPTSRLGSSCVANVTEHEITSAMETDENVEKAEAYAKELEDICNMLRKKHEEAKELLVRAVVNNNNLLMLNHPIYEAKIHKVQKFAAKLVSQELQAC